MLFTQADKDAILAPAVALRDYVRPLPVDNVQPPPPPPAGNWLDRINATGVVRAMKLDTMPPIGGNLNYAVQRGVSAPKGIAVLDTEPDGISSLLFNIPGLSGSDACGAFYMNNAADYGSQLREGGEMFWQVRTKHNRAMCETVLYEIDYEPDPPFNLIPGTRKQGGVKIFDVTFGDEPTSPVIRHYSSAMGKVVVQRYYQTWGLQMYAYDASSNNSGFHERIVSPSDWRIQNGTSPYCLFTNASGKTGPIAGCFGPEPDVWMTWTQGIALGPLGVDVNGHKVWTQARRRLWGQRGTDRRQLLIDFKPGVNGYFDQRADDLNNTTSPTILGIGKMYAMPYATNKDPLQDHPLLQARYREVIVSTQDIAEAA